MRQSISIPCNASMHRQAGLVRREFLGWLAGSGSLLAAMAARAQPTEWVSLQSINYPDHVVRHRDFLGEIAPVRSRQDADDASFRLVPGLAGGDTVSFESRNFPGHLLRHQGFRIKLHRPDGSDLFRQDASFKMVPGLADASWRSFESVNYPGHYLRHRDFHLYIERGDGDLFRRDTTFRLVPPAVAAQPGSSEVPMGAWMSLRSVNYPDHHVRHRNFLGEITTLASALDMADSSFRMVPGLAGGASVSFEAKNFPGHYLRHQDFRIKLHRPDGSALFRNDASFKVLAGLADPNARSFESVNYPGHFLRHRDFHLYIERGDGDLFRKDTTFLVELRP